MYTQPTFNVNKLFISFVIIFKRSHSYPVNLKRVREYRSVSVRPTHECSGKWAAVVIELIVRMKGNYAVSSCVFLIGILFKRNVKH